MGTPKSTLEFYQILIINDYIFRQNIKHPSILFYFFPKETGTRKSLSESSKHIVDNPQMFVGWMLNVRIHIYSIVNELEKQNACEI